MFNCTCEFEYACPLRTVKWTFLKPIDKINVHDRLLTRLKSFVPSCDNDLLCMSVHTDYRTVKLSWAETQVCLCKSVHDMMHMCKLCNGSGLCHEAKKELNSSAMHNITHVTSLCTQCYGFQKQPEVTNCVACKDSGFITQPKSMTFEMSELKNTTKDDVHIYVYPLENSPALMFACIFSNDRHEGWSRWASVSDCNF